MTFIKKLIRTQIWYIIEQIVFILMCTWDLDNRSDSIRVSCEKLWCLTQPRYTDRLPFVIGVRTQVHPFVVERIWSRSLLIFGAHEVPETPFVQVCPAVHQYLYHGRIFVDNGHVQYALSCIKNRFRNHNKQWFIVFIQLRSGKTYNIINMYIQSSINS